MAEYIDRNAFKKSVEERYCEPCKAEGKDHNGCWCRACWVDDMLDEVDCFPPYDASGKLAVLRWIPVTEQLPGNFEYVLCWYEYFRYGDYNAMYATYGIGYQCNGNWGGEVSNGTNARVLAWMPLPGAPDEKALEAMKND